MNLISSYSSLPPTLQTNSNNTPSKELRSTDENLQRLIKTMRERFSNLSFTVIEPELNNRGEIVTCGETLSFTIIHDACVSQYDYCFNIEINMGIRSLKITAIIIKEGRVLNIYKEGIAQMLCNYSLEINGLMSYFSLRLNPYTGAIKFIYLSHMTLTQMEEMFIFPAAFSENIKLYVSKMVERLDERLLGKILHLSNQISLKNIIPETFDCPPPLSLPAEISETASIHPLYPNGTIKNLWTINNKLKTLRRYLANSTIRYPFFSAPESSSIKFFPEIQSRRRETERERRMTRHNIRILPFSNDIRKIMGLYTPTNRLKEEEDSYRTLNEGFDSWLEPTEEEIAEVYEILKCENLQHGGHAMKPISVVEIENEVHIAQGGFAEILKVGIKIREIEPQGQPNGQPRRIIRTSLIKKSAARERLFWEKSIINHIGKGACIFINKYYDPRIDPEAIGLTREMFDQSIFMDFCRDGSFGNYYLRNHSMMSTYSRVFLLFQTSVGLRYLRDFGVVHLDLKPENVLLKTMYMGGSNALMLIKLIDFGEAFCETLIGGRINRGHTCPYAPPELVRNSDARYTERSDVFSLGVMILIMVFELNTTDIKRLTSAVVFESNERYMKMYSICIEKCRYLGYEPLMQTLLCLAFKCISPNVTARPLLNWVCVILRKFLTTYNDLERNK